MDVNTSLACYPGFTHHQAMQAALDEQHRQTLSEPVWGDLKLEHVQVVPQSRGVMTEESAQLLKDDFPAVKFRLHANVRVLPERCIYDIANYPTAKAWFLQAAKIQSILGASVYSAHAGLRKDATLEQMFDYARTLADLFGQPVAIEGLYPDKTNSQLLSTWDEYAQLLDSGLPYALDLSHLHIVATHVRFRDKTLTQELLASEQCLEIHVSDNNGRGDWHQRCERVEMLWWYELLRAHRNPKAVIFTEGNRRAHQSPYGPR